MLDVFSFASGPTGSLGGLLFALVLAVVGFAVGVLWTRRRVLRDPEFLLKAQAALQAKRDELRARAAALSTKAADAVNTLRKD